MIQERSEVKPGENKQEFSASESQGLSLGCSCHRVRGGVGGPLNGEGVPGRPEARSSRRSCFLASWSRDCCHSPSSGALSVASPLVGALLRRLNLVLGRSKRRFSVRGPAPPTPPAPAWLPAGQRPVCPVRASSLPLSHSGGRPSLSPAFPSPSSWSEACLRSTVPGTDAGEIMACRVAPLSKPHSVRGKWGAFLWFADLILTLSRPENAETCPPTQLCLGF